MSVDYQKLQIIHDMKICQECMQKIATELLERSEKHIDHRANMLQASSRIIGEWIQEIENEQ